MDGEEEGNGTEENCSAVWLAVSSFLVMELISRSLAWPVFGLTQGPSWWCVYLAAKMDSSEKDSGRLAGQYYGLASPASF